MKKSRLVAILALCVAVSFLWQVAGGQAPAQQPGMTPPTSTALIDINFIMKQHAGFKANMNQMKADVDRAEADVKAESEAIKKIAEGLPELKPGSPDYKVAEERLVHRQSDLASRVQLQKREFLQREAQIYSMVYQEISQEVADYCKQYNITLVLKYNGDPLDPNHPEDVLRVINGPVVYHAPQTDITSIIVDSLNRRLAGARGADNRYAPQPRGVYVPGQPR